jgi:hypothetical protein
MYMWLYAMYSAAPAASVRGKYGERRTLGWRRWLAMPPPYQRRFSLKFSRMLPMNIGYLFG